MLILGVDPGIKGAFAMYNVSTHSLEYLSPMPIYTMKNGKSMVDAEQLFIQISMYKSRLMLAVVEDVHAMTGQGVVSTFRFGESRGMILGVLASLGIRTVFVRAAVWKLYLGLSRDKALSLSLAIKTFPGHAKEFQRKRDVDKAEAALIAYFGAVAGA